jgi:hypothetical protein
MSVDWTIPLSSPPKFSCFDTETYGGTCSEVIETVEIRGFFDVIRAADGWVGSGRVRTIG